METERLEELTQFLEGQLSLRHFLETHCTVDDFGDCDGIVIFSRNFKTGKNFEHFLMHNIPELKNMKFYIRKDRYDCKPKTSGMIINDPLDYGKVHNIIVTSPDGKYENATIAQDTKAYWIDLNGFQSHESIGTDYADINFQSKFGDIFASDEDF